MIFVIFLIMYLMVAGAVGGRLYKIDHRDEFYMIKAFIWPIYLPLVCGEKIADLVFERLDKKKEK
jgi:hypothetical protein